MKVREFHEYLAHDIPVLCGLESVAFVIRVIHQLRFLQLRDIFHDQIVNLLLPGLIILLSERVMSWIFLDPAKQK